jgi:hypothetical protein
VGLKNWIIRQVLAHRLRSLRDEVRKRWREGGLPAVLASRKAWSIVVGTVAQGLKRHGVKLDARAWVDAIVAAAQAAAGGNDSMNPNVSVKGSKTVLGSVLLGLSVLLYVVAAIPVAPIDPFDSLAKLAAGMVLSAGVTTFGIGLRHAIEKTRATFHVAAEAIDQALAEIQAKAEAAEGDGKTPPSPFRPKAV